MKYCYRCAAPLADAEIGCPRCGSWQPVVPVPATPAPLAPALVSASPAAAAVAEGEPLRERGVTGTFLWGLLVSMVANPLGTPLAMFGAGMAASCSAIGAKGDLRARLRTSRLLCIVASVVDAVTAVVLVVLLFYAITRFGGVQSLFQSMLGGQG